jgi:hypothetical protein
MISNTIFKCIGFIDFDEREINALQADGFNLIKSNDQLNEFLESTYHSEYLKIMFNDDCVHLSKELTHEVHLNKVDKNVVLNSVDLFVFVDKHDSHTVIYSLDYLIDVETVEEFSDVTYQLINHQSEITADNTTYKQIDFISETIFNGKKLNDISSDLSQFSGNKFKHYSIVDFKENDFETDALLFELGTSSKIGSISDGGINAPSEKYFNSILENKLSCFNNYSGLSLYDSFTIVGVNNYDRSNIYSHSTWDAVYFKIFIYNQFLKSRLQIITNSFTKDSLKSRSLFKSFYNKYYLNKISFNFLPNEIHKTIYNSLEIDTDIDFLRERVDTLTDQINETQQKQQEFLLFCISVLALLETPLHIDGIRSIIGIDNYFVYNSIVYPTLVLSLIIIIVFKFKKNKKV